MGESPERVFNVGAIGLDSIKKCKFLSKEELEKSLDFDLGDKSLLITYHPVTLENDTARQQCDNLLSVLDNYQEYKIIFTLPNSDTGGRVIMESIQNFVSRNKNRAAVFTSLGKIRYLSALNYVSAVIGNSSSGILEVPSFGIPTLNIGDRQKGRIAATSVVHCGTTIEEISLGFDRLFSEEILSVAKERKNPYEKAGTIEQILSVLKSYPLDWIIQKTFYNM